MARKMLKTNPPTQPEEQALPIDPFLQSYQPSELAIAAEFFTTWLPFLTKDLCHHCTQTVSHRIRSLDPGGSGDNEALQSGESVKSSSQTHHDGWEESDRSSIGSWKDGANGCLDSVPNVATPVLNGRSNRLPNGSNPVRNVGSDSVPSGSTPVRHGRSNYVFSGSSPVRNGWSDSVANGSTSIRNGWSDSVRKGSTPVRNGWSDSVANGSTSIRNGWSDSVRKGSYPVRDGWSGHVPDSSGPSGSVWSDHVPDASAPSATGWSDHGPDASAPSVTGLSDHVNDASISSRGILGPGNYSSPSVRLSWADMAQEDELFQEEEEERVVDKIQSVENDRKVEKRRELSREQREYIRFKNVERKKDFIFLEKIKGQTVNILEGLELHKCVFSAAEQKRIVDFVYDLQEKGWKGELRARTFTSPQKWMRGKGRVTIQFGCCYNYATDRAGNPPGILRNEQVDPIPDLFKVIIKRLVRWHVLPPSCVPDSCIVNIYEEEDCIPPHIDNHDFVRPFCTVSFLSECNILFGRNLQIIGPGEFSGATAIPLPVGSVLVLNGNGADVAKHCVPAVPTKRISITFRKMDEAKRPVGFAPERDLQGLQPLPYHVIESNSESDFDEPMSAPRPNRPQFIRNIDSEMRRREFSGRGSRSVPHQLGRSQPSNRQRVRINLGT